MQLEVDPVPVRRRPTLPVVVVAACTVGVVAFALLTGGGTGLARPVSSAMGAMTGTAPAPAAATPVPARVVSSGSAPGYVARLPPPDAIACHGLGPAACAAVALAAVSRLPVDDRVVASIEAWASLLCSDEVDCPRSQLAGNRPLGSAILTTGSGARVWVNVLQPAALTSGSAAASPAAFAGDSTTTPRTTAWIIRWQP